jgi:hypothetical protein
MAWEMAIPAVVTALAGLFGGKEGALTDEQKMLLEDAMQTQNARVNVQNPLYEMATQLAMNLMPRSAQVPKPFLFNPYKPPAGAGANAGSPYSRPRPEGTYPSGWAVPRPTTTSPINEAVTRLGRSRLFQMPPTR